MYEYKFPFEPPLEDLKMVLEGDGGTCYIFDTFCKNITNEQKREADRRILSIYYHNAEAALIRNKNEKQELSL